MSTANAEAWQAFWDAMNGRWFGTSWHVGNLPQTRVDTPIGGRCTACGQVIRQGDQGIQLAIALEEDLWANYHRRCWESLLQDEHD